MYLRQSVCSSRANPLRIFGVAGTRIASCRNWNGEGKAAVDPIFPVAYGLLFTLLVPAVFEDGGSTCCRIPAAATHVLENFSIALLVASCDGIPTPATTVAAVFTLLKSALLPVVLAAAVGGAIGWLGMMRRPV